MLDKVLKYDSDVLTAVHYFMKYPYAMRSGKGWLSKRLKVSPESIVEARKITRSRLNDGNFEVSDAFVFPKVLILDIETSPMRAYVWKRWKEDISLDQTISEWFCISWAAKWLYNEDGEYDDEVFGTVLTDSMIKKENDYFLMYKLREYLDKADIVVAHNGIRFDIPRINARFISLGIDPPSPYHIVDTLKEAKKVFAFSSNKLDALAQYLHTGTQKIKTDFSLWKRCLEGDTQALCDMLEYNKQDVLVLEKVYLKMRPFIKGHPNMGAILAKDNVCPVCGHSIEKTDYYYSTSVNRYRIYKCTHCKSLVRSRLPEAKSKVTHVSLGH